VAAEADDPSVVGRNASKSAVMAVLPLALWSASPTFQWCTVSWSEVTIECVVASARGPCDARSQAACDTGCRFDAGTPCEASDPCADTPPSEDPASDAERAWCVSAPFPGLPRAALEDPTSDAAVLPGVLASLLVAERDGSRMAPAPSWPRPPTPAANAPPPARAPPLA
jgi:hypothetical protein